jgi:hypothetical protein
MIWYTIFFIIYILWYMLLNFLRTSRSFVKHPFDIMVFTFIYTGRQIVLQSAIEIRPGQGVSKPEFST